MCVGGWSHPHCDPQSGSFSARRGLWRFGCGTRTVLEYTSTRMSEISIVIPDSLRQRAEAIARAEGQALETFVASVLSQRVAVAEAESYVRRRGERGSAEKMLEILAASPKVGPEPNDVLPNRDE